VGDVVALDPQRGLGQVEVVLEGREGPGPGVVVGGPLEPVAGEGLLGVLGDGLEEAPLVAPFRHPDPHLGSPDVAEELLVQLEVLRLDR
jgi:hypothetical protein